MRRRSFSNLAEAAAGMLLLTAVSVMAGPTSGQAVKSVNTTPLAAKPGVASGAAATSADGKEKWLSTLDDAYAEARKDARPILVRAGATWCSWCRKLDEEIAKPAVQKALTGYVLVYLDIDEEPRDARSLGIDAVPALRVLTPMGRVTASQNGYLEADDLAKWLTGQRSKAAVAVPGNLVGDEPPDSKDVQELIAQLSGREPLYREAAIQRLMRHPQVAAPAVAKLFAEGGLSERLAAMELLRGWRAPTQDLDPWQPDTLTRERVEALLAWAEQASDVATSAPAELVGESLETARRELARFLQAERDAEAEVVRERLARLGPALLPVVVAELKNAPKDRDRERLTALRYRLAAPGRLAMEWPGGFERLASLSAETRQKAAEDLARLAQADTAPLLRELFSNPDPLVREVSLRALRKVGGEEANEALTSLLNDPEPNVRAAVLKQLAEQPSRKMVPKLAEYAGREKDADLLVHAVRVLRAAGGKAALDALIAMSGHDTWQVRAEVAEAIGEVLNQSGDLPQESRADAYVALISMLKDSDGFVVSRAMAGLQHADVSLVIKPLVQATEDHPELAGPLLEMLTHRGGDQNQITRHLRDLCKSKHAAVRAAAIVQLCQTLPNQSSEELVAAFGDPEEDVRFAAAKGFLNVLDSCRPSEQSAMLDMMGSGSDMIVVETTERSGTLSRLLRVGSTGTVRRVVTRPAASPEAAPRPESQPAKEQNWLDQFRAGTNRPKWMEQVVPPLQALISSPRPERRLTAAVGLIAMGRDDAALSVLRESARSQPALAGQAARALRWLPLKERLSLFDELLAMASDTQPRVEVINGMVVDRDLRAAAPLWELLAKEDEAAGWAETIQRSLRRLYFGQEYPQPRLKPSWRTEVVAALKPLAETGPELRRVVALSLLLTGSKTDATAIAGKLYEDASNGKELRADALQILLLGQPRDQAAKTAVAALSSPDDNVRGVALLYLARGRSNLQVLRGGVTVYLPSAEPSFEDINQSGSPIVPQAPPGLKERDVRPLLSSTDGATRAHAGYLLALLKQADGLGPLVDYWRQNARNDWAWRRQVYRAITALNDDKLTGMLEEIYKDVSQEQWQVKEFYWTIRSMEGEEVLELRKKIRTEVGMDRLK